MTAEITPTPATLFKHLQPALDEVQRLMLTAPTEPKRRAALAVLVAQYFFTAAAASVEGIKSMTADELAEALVVAYRRLP